MNRTCFREPIPEIFEAAFYLDVATHAHVLGNRSRASEYLLKANINAVRDWTESLWGIKSPYLSLVAAKQSEMAIDLDPKRMPTMSEKRTILARDGFHCRFCGTPVIRPEVRAQLRREYPEALSWGGSNAEQHSAFQAMWLQFDHLVPHTRGGRSSVENVLITCAPCNFCRMNYTLDEVSICDPFDRPPIISSWDGLERVMTA